MRTAVMAKCKPAIAFLRIKFANNENIKAFGITNLRAGLNSAERRLLTANQGKWQYAILQMKGSKEIIHYYHPTKGINRLNKQEYTALLKQNSYSLYIIPTTAYKYKTGCHKPNCKKVFSLDDVPQYFNKDVLRIDIYQAGKKINSYNGKFLK